MPDDENSAPQAVGIIDGQGRGNKRSPGIALNGVTRRMLEDSLTGYLSEFEALYQAGEIKDYHMFPAVALNRALPSRLRSRPRCRRSRSTRWKSFGGELATRGKARGSQGSVGARAEHHQSGRGNGFGGPRGGPQRESPGPCGGPGLCNY